MFKPAEYDCMKSISRTKSVDDRIPNLPSHLL